MYVYSAWNSALLAQHHPRNMKRTLLTLFAMLIASAMALPANADIDCDAAGPDDVTQVTVKYSYQITYCGSEVVDGNTVFKWEIEELDGEGLSHFTLGLCEPLEVLGYSPTADSPLIEEVKFGPDPTTGGLSGIKWGWENELVAAAFTITVAGIVGEGDVSVAFKDGDGYDTGITTGPNCQQEICRSGTLPSWDGELDIVPYSQGVDPKVFIDLSTPNGFKSIEVKEGSQNTALVSIVNELHAGYNAQPTAFTYDGYDKLEWVGISQVGDPEPVPPTSVRIQFGPREKTGMRFMFLVEDKDGCKLQVDPVIDFDVPETVELRGNYPNPFNPTTNIEFSVPEAMDVRLDIYDAMGRLVKSLVNDNLEAGVHNVSWNGTDAAGRQVASGAYFYRVQTGSVVQTKQMILLK